MDDDDDIKCDECDGSGLEADHFTECHLCEGAGWFGSDGFPLDDGDDDS